ncbi:MAG: GNAT family N-acetyltransferase [Chitinophagales bacterium]
MLNKYIFQSQRLGFRNWRDTDVQKMAAISANKEVMRFFSSVKSEAQTASFIEAMQKEYNNKGFCYFAVEILETNEMIGFIGLSAQDYECDFTPFVDIGWRLAEHTWNNGYATEGAKRCLKYAFEVLHLNEVYAVTPVPNKKSERIMQKIGMTKVATFAHPLLLNDERLKMCVLYRKQFKLPL